MIIRIGGTHFLKKGSRHKKFSLYYVNIIPNKKPNLLSITNSLKSDWKLGGENKEICTTNNIIYTRLYIYIKTKGCVIFEICLDRNVTK